MMEALKALEREIFGEEVALMSPTIEEAFGDDFRRDVEKEVRKRLAIIDEMLKGRYDVDEVVEMTEVKREVLLQLMVLKEYVDFELASSYEGFTEEDE